jgi:hypothetical protein
MQNGRENDGKRQLWKVSLLNPYRVSARYGVLLEDYFNLKPKKDLFPHAGNFRSGNGLLLSGISEWITSLLTIMFMVRRFPGHRPGTFTGGTIVFLYTDRLYNSCSGTDRR